VREDAPPCRIGQRRESAIQHLGGIFNHLVNYIARKCGLANRKFRPHALPKLPGFFPQNSADFSFQLNRKSVSESGDWWKVLRLLHRL